MESEPRKPGNLSKADYIALARFRYTLRRFLHFSEKAAGEHGLTPQQYQTLLAIEGFHGEHAITIGELAEQLLIAHHSAGGLVSRLESLGLVYRKRCSSDARRVRIYLTEQGKEILDNLFRVHHQELRMFEPQLSQLAELSTDSWSAPASGQQPE